jgi:hypothetical protein
MACIPPIVTIRSPLDFEFFALFLLGANQEEIKHHDHEADHDDRVAEGAAGLLCESKNGHLRIGEKVFWCASIDEARVRRS